MTSPGLPSRGQLNWDVPLNDYLENDVDQAGSAVAAVADHAGAADPHGDRSYANQLTSGFTTGANGPNGFLKLDSTGHIPATLAPTGGGISNLYDVKANFGATGNGSTDDSAAINNALTGCANAGGGWVWIPAGTYAIASTLVIGSNTALVLVPGAVIKRITSGGSTPVTMLANYTNSSTAGASNILVMGGSWNAANVSTNCTPMSFVNGSGITVRDAAITSVAGSSGNPAVLMAGCSNVTLDNVALPGAAPAGSRTAYFTPAFRIESTASAVVSGLNSVMYTGSPPCKNVTIINCDLTASTASDSNGTYTFYKYLAGTVNAVSSSYHQNITVAQNTVTGVCSSAVNAANWQYCNVNGNIVQSYLWPFVATSWAPTTAPSPILQVNSANTADSWHLLSVAGGWTNGSSNTPPVYYRMDSPDVVRLTGTIQLPSTGSYNATPFATLPSAYWPQITKRWFPFILGDINWAEGNSSYTGPPQVYISASGQLQLYGIPGNLGGTALGTLDISGTYPVSA